MTPIEGMDPPRFSELGRQRWRRRLIILSELIKIAGTALEEEDGNDRHPRDDIIFRRTLLLACSSLPGVPERSYAQVGAMIHVILLGDSVFDNAAMSAETS